MYFDFAKWGRTYQLWRNATDTFAILVVCAQNAIWDEITLPSFLVCGIRIIRFFKQKGPLFRPIRHTCLLSGKSSDLINFSPTTVQNKHLFYLPFPFNSIFSNFSLHFRVAFWVAQVFVWPAKKKKQQRNTRVILLIVTNNFRAQNPGLLKVLLKAYGRQNIALHASPTASNIFLSTSCLARL